MPSGLLRNLLVEMVGFLRGRWSRLSTLVPAALTIIALGIVLILWVRSAPFPIRGVGSPEEVAYAALSGRNFVHHGFLKRGLLPDYSTDPRVDAPPLYYSHNPPLSDVIMGLLFSLGVTDMSSVRLGYMAGFLLGVPVALAFFRQFLSVWHGVAVVSFMMIDVEGVLAWIDHPIYAFWFGLIFLAMWCLTNTHGRIWEWSGATAVLLISLMSYLQLVICLVIVSTMWIMCIKGVTFRKVAIAWFAAMGGVSLHVLQNILVLGWDTTWHDIAMTLSNRMVGQPSRDALLSFYQDHDLILWGTSGLSPASGRVWSLIASFMAHGGAVVLSLLGLAALAFFWRLESALRAIRLSVSFLVGALAWPLIFQGHAQTYHFPPAIALVTATVPGLFVVEFGRILYQGCLDLLRLLNSSFLINININLALIALGFSLNAHNLAELYGWMWNTEASWNSLDRVEIHILQGGLIVAGICGIFRRLKQDGESTNLLGKLQLTTIMQFKTYLVTSQLQHPGPRGFVYILALVSYVMWQSISSVNLDLLSEPSGVVRELELLKNFEGHGFWTNASPALVSLYTGSWAVGNVGVDALRERDITKAATVLVSRRSVTWNEAARSRWFFYNSAAVSSVLPCRIECQEELRQYLERNFSIVARTPSGSMVVDLDSPPQV